MPLPSFKARSLKSGAATPARVIAFAYAVGIAIGTLLLMLPISKTGPGGASLVEAAFTTVSALCVTGLAVVDTATYWTGFGQGVILAEIAIGGFGIMAISTVVGIFFANKIGLKARLNAANESGLVGLGSMRSVLRRVAILTVSIEFVIGLLLFVRFVTGYAMDPAKAIWFSAFHSISAFNNAGFALYSDSLMSFVNDPYVQLPLHFAVILGSLGFPVIIKAVEPTRTARSETRSTDFMAGGRTKGQRRCYSSLPQPGGRREGDRPGAVTTGYLRRPESLARRRVP